LRLSAAQVAGADIDHTVRQIHRLQNGFGVTQYLEVVFLAFFDIVFTDNDLFDFVKLMDAVQAARVLARGAGLAAKTGTQSYGLDRKLGFSEDLAGMIGRYRNLCRAPTKFKLSRSIW
jgi:hypothetical protein